MKSVYVFTTNLMNGTVTMHTEVTATTTRELAEKAKEDLTKAIAKGVPGILRVMFSDIEEISVYETEGELYSSIQL